MLDITQQLRGAHFLSHGVWSMIIALSISYLSFRSLQKFLLIKNKFLTQ
jgi:membrane-associated PAP2 superfamily phosphatase